MKKFIAIIAAIALIATMSVSAFAWANETTADYCAEAGTIATGGIHTDADKDVYVTLTGDVTHVVCVEVTWADMYFEYDGDMVWDPHTMEYVPADDSDVGFTVVGDNTIAFENRSDVEVTIGLSYSNDAVAYSEVTGKFVAEDADAAAAAVTQVVLDPVVQTAGVATTTEGSADFWPTSAPSIAIDDNGDAILVGSITIQITAPADVVA